MLPLSLGAATAVRDSATAIGVVLGVRLPLPDHRPAGHRPALAAAPPAGTPLELAQSVDVTTSTATAWIVVSYLRAWCPQKTRSPPLSRTMRVAPRAPHRSQRSAAVSGKAKLAGIRVGVMSIPSRLSAARVAASVAQPWQLLVAAGLRGRCDPGSSPAANGALQTDDAATRKSWRPRRQLRLRGSSGLV